MNIAILAVGTELLMGKTVNTNATELSKWINELGHSVKYHMTIGDNPERLKATLDYLLTFNDMIITTGGLGPTQDDLTKETIAKTFGLSLIKNEEAHYQMLERFKNFNVTMTDNNKKQAYLPEGAIPMYNDRGTAPGFISEVGDKIIAALPGPPREMSHMFEKDLRPFLISKSTQQIVSEYINLFGIGESSAENLVEDIISNQTNPTIAIYANIGQVSLRVTAGANTTEKAHELLKPVVENLSNRLKNYVIGYGNKTIISSTIDQIVNEKLTVSLAESCTGGMIASELVNFSGASTFFHSSYVTYSNEAKINALGVKQATLDTFGAVSSETCKEMVEGLYLKTQSDICLAVTGIAGPNGGTKEKPVGLVYIGLTFKGVTTIHKHQFTGSRYVIRRRTLLASMGWIHKAINNLNHNVK